MDRTPTKVGRNCTKGDVLVQNYVIGEIYDIVNYPKHTKHHFA